MFNSPGGFNAPPVSSGYVGTTLREAVRSRLLESPGVTDLVDDRVFFGAIPQSARLPAVTYAVISRTTGHNLRGADGVSASLVQVSVWSTKQADCAALAEAIRDRFDGFQGRFDEVEILSCLLQNEVDLPEPPRASSDSWTYQIAIDYRISHRVSIPSQPT